jgi:hypothetical protein
MVEQIHATTSMLCLQTAQIVKRVRAEASEEGLKLSFGSYLRIILSARSQATEYSTCTKLDFVKTVIHKKLWLCMVQRMLGASGQIPRSI